jgi:hypothetical protein
MYRMISNDGIQVYLTNRVLNNGPVNFGEWTVVAI